MFPTRRSSRLCATGHSRRCGPGGTAPARWSARATGYFLLLEGAYKWCKTSTTKANPPRGGDANPKGLQAAAGLPKGRSRARMCCIVIPRDVRMRLKGTLPRIARLQGWFAMSAVRISDSALRRRGSGIGGKEIRLLRTPSETQGRGRAYSSHRALPGAEVPRHAQ